MDSKKVYSREYLEGLKDHQLLSILKEWWANPSSSKISVWGKLHEKRSMDGRYFYRLEEAKSIIYDESIEYPINDVRAISDDGIHVYTSKDRVFDGYDFPAYVRCDLVLSNRKERKKHNNPLDVCVRFDSIEPLLDIPKINKDEIINSDVGSYISKSIHDLYLKKNTVSIDAEKRKLEKSIRNEHAELISSLGLKAESLSEAVSDAESEHKRLQGMLSKTEGAVEKKKNEHNKIIEFIEELSEEKDALQYDIKSLISKRKKFENDMSIKMEKLNSYIKDKADLLRDFEFIDEDEYDGLILKTKNTGRGGPGLIFSEDFSSDYARSVSYIQAYLMDKDILYPRHVVENFFTLLRTNDLIILTGDSGSGKTNLVQSFAKAIGGVSKIIPVKPNWTSSEDLLGYYNPLEKKYLATPFLEALIEANKNPNVPYLICLDEMNLARVEYYFADFLSKLEQRGEAAEIELYSEAESAHVLSELKSVINIINGAREKFKKNDVVDFVKLLQDKEINEEIKRTFGFSDKDSLIKYHGDLRRMLAGVIDTPPLIIFPANVRIVGTVNIDETTHYLSPKILDRAHIMKFNSPLLTDWGKIKEEVGEYGFDDVSKVLRFDSEELGNRAVYPKFDPDNKFCKFFVDMNRNYFSPIGIEFGMRTIRQGLNYLELFEEFNPDYDVAVNNFMLHKVFPKFSFDGNKELNDVKKSDFLYGIETSLEANINSESIGEGEFSAKIELKKIISKAQSNDWIVNYWS